MRRHLIIITTMTLFVLACFLAQEWWRGGRRELVVHFFDVGQGDSALLISPTGKQILIDGGPDLTALDALGRYAPFLDRTIELLVLTHPHKDHVAAFPEILRRYKVERILLTGVAYESPMHEEFLSLVLAEHAQVIFPDPAVDIDLGDGLILDVVWPRDRMVGVEVGDDHLNDTSVALRALFGSSAVLMAGDMEVDAEMGVLASGADVRAQVLKVGHHGSRTSTSTGFLLAVDPEVAIISAGRQNSFGHPHLSTLRRLEHFGVQILRTAEEGTITIRCSRERCR